MKKIIPTESTFRKWAQSIPADGDLLFFKSAKDLKPFENSGLKFTTDEVRSQSLVLWNLSHRSWYGYALGKAKYCLWFPPGQIERFDQKQLLDLAKLQVALEVPTLLTGSRGKHVVGLLKVGSWRWITSQSWLKLSSKERAHSLKCWFAQNRIHIYSSFEFAELPIRVKREVQRRNLKKKLNSYASVSGPNCLATAATALSGTSIDLWLLAEPFKRFLLDGGLVATRDQVARAQDVLVFSKDRQIVHAAYVLGEGYIFEKPGQDFYEPYRIGKLRDLMSEWPNTNLQIWRKN